MVGSLPKLMATQVQNSSFFRIHWVHSSMAAGDTPATSSENLWWDKSGTFKWTRLNKMSNKKQGQTVPLDHPSIAMLVFGEFLSDREQRLFSLADQNDHHVLNNNIAGV